MEATIKIKKVENGFYYTFDGTGENPFRKEMIFLNLSDLRNGTMQHLSTYFPTEG